MTQTPQPASAFDCRSCGACCAYSRTWPRFSTETDDQLALIPAELVRDDQGGMRCFGERCAAFDGDVGRAARCTIYDLRPDVCRACQPGDDACRTARAWHGLPG